ncbi:MAG: hypothetical protein ACE5FO_13345 [Parvularculaceae bacterium]
MPPDLITLAAFNGDWAAYEDTLHEIFINEIARGGLTFDGLRVSCRRIPETDNRWASFWHLIQEGKVEENRTPDLRRCERIRWVRWIIQNSNAKASIEVWRNKRKSETNILLWYREEYLVVLSERRDYFLLKTAYCTERRRRIEQLRRERDAYLQGGGI